MAITHTTGLEFDDKSVYGFVNNQHKTTKKKDLYHFNKLRLYRGRPYTIPIPDLYKDTFTRPITIYTPKVKDIIDFDEYDGDTAFYSQLLNPFIAHTTQYRLILWKNGKDQNNIPDFELFCSLIRTLDGLDTSVLFGDLNFNLFKPYRFPLSEEDIKANEEHKDDKKQIPIRPKMLLLNEEQKVAIDEKVYDTMAEYLRTMFNIFPKVEKATGLATKKSIIQEDEFNQQMNKDKESSFLQPLISACVNHPGFKYKTSELDEVNIVEFMDSVKRLQIYESTVSLSRGMYSGFCDVSKVDKNLFNFMRDID